MPVGATIAATSAGSIAQGAAGASAANSANKAAQANLAFQKGVYSDATGNLQPSISRGNESGQMLQDLIDGNPGALQKFLKSTNYEFTRDQGLKGVAQQNAPTWGGGATGKALINYSENLAQGALGQYTSLLSGQQTLGVNAAGALSNVGTNIAQQNAAANNSAASAAGGAALNGANALQNGLSGVLQGINQSRTQSSFGGPGQGSFGGITYGATGIG
jgi:hypothetical protein